MIESLRGFIDYWREFEGPISLVPTNSGILIEGDAITYQVVSQIFPTFTSSNPTRLVESVWQIDFFGSQVQPIKAGIRITPQEKVKLIYTAFSTWLTTYPQDGLINISNDVTFIPNVPNDKNQFVRLSTRYTVTDEQTYVLKNRDDIIENIEAYPTEVD